MPQLFKLDEAAGDVAVGSVLGGRYELLARIGAGGMATIYRGRDATLERDVAVKVLHAHLADDASVLARFRTEARHAARLVHPHIVHVYDQGDAALPYIVMEHVDGPSLRDVLVARGHLSPGEALSIIEPVCLALERAHGAGVVHRDIKPENVLVTAEGVAKVADFGIARALAEANHTQTGALVGSVHYLAPELVEGRDATFASDQYAVGVLLFELLTGRKALTAESPMAVAIRHGREPIPPPSTMVDGVGAELDTVVATATAMDPATRFANLRDLVAALSAAVPAGAEPVVVTAVGRHRGEQTLVIAPAGPLAPADVEPATDDTMILADQDMDDTVVLAEQGGGDTARLPVRVDDPDLDDLDLDLDLDQRVRPPAAVPAPTQAPPRRRGRRVLVGLLLSVLVLALLAGAALATWNFVIAPVQQVPQLTGTTEDSAREVLGRRGFELAVNDRQHSRTVAEGVVLLQDAAPGSSLRRGATVGVVVSQGPAPVEVPSVVGTPLDEARSTLEGAPFHLVIDRVDEAHSDTVPAGVVIAQSPDADTVVRQGDAVVLQVSLGVEQVTVPDLAGLDREEAQATLADARLLASITERHSDDVPTAGMVISQSVDAEQRVDVGSTIEVVVSLGPLTVTVPDVEGEDLETAVAALRALDLEPRVIEEPRPRLGPFRIGSTGRVEAQDPRPGDQVERGTTIELYTYVDDGGDNGGDDGGGDGEAEGDGD
jgi:eukaryotic-like serine/threonine-protein kinase